MKYFITLGFLFFVSLFVKANEKYSKLRILFTKQVNIQTLAALGLEVDHGVITKQFIESDFSSEERNLLTEQGISFTVVIDDVVAYYMKRSMEWAANKKTRAVTCHSPNPSYTTPTGFNYGSMGGFFTYNEAINKLDSLAILFPNLVTTKQPIGSHVTFQNRPIHFVKISDNPNTNENEPHLLFNAAHHAREAITVSQIIYFMYYLCENYNSNANVKRLVDNIEFYFVPIVNPDGYVYNELTDPGGGGMWRKNRRSLSTNVFGVDLNRNYGLGWAFNNFGSSPNQNSSTYRGPSAFSEPETKAMRDFCNAHQFRFGINYHSYSNLIIYPWGYLETNCNDSIAYRAFSSDLTKYNFYKSGTDMETVGYATNGSSDDWMYGETVTKPMMFAMTPEVGNGDDGFWPQVNRIIPLCEESNYMNLTIAQYVLAYAQVESITPRITGNTNGYVHYQINRLGLDTSGVFTVSLLPLSTNIVTTGASKTYSNLTLAQTYTDSIAYTLQSGLANNTEVKFVLSCSNGGNTEYDTISSYYGNKEVVYQSDASSFTGWTNNGWDIDMTRFTSTGGSFAENPLGIYDSMMLETLVSPPLDLTQASKAELLYRANWDMENSYDYVQLEASTNGINFSPVCSRNTQPIPNAAITEEKYTGVVSDWKYEIINLDDYVGNANVVLRWTFTSDQGLNRQGFNMDDFLVQKLSTTPASIANQEWNELYLYPNPASTTLQLSFKNKLMYSIRCIDGRVVQKGTCSGAIDIGLLANGIYQLELNGHSGQKTNRQFTILND